MISLVFLISFIYGTDLCEIDDEYLGIVGCSTEEEREKQRELFEMFQQRRYGFNLTECNTENPVLVGNEPENLEEDVKCDFDFKSKLENLVNLRNKVEKENESKFKNFSILNSAMEFASGFAEKFGVCEEQNNNNNKPFNQEGLTIQECIENSIIDAYLNEKEYNSDYPHLVLVESRRRTSKIGNWLHKELEHSLVSNEMKDVIKRLRFNTDIPDKICKVEAIKQNTKIMAEYIAKSMMSLGKHGSRPLLAMKSGDSISFRDITARYDEVSQDDFGAILCTGQDDLMQRIDALKEIFAIDDKDSALILLCSVLGTCLVNPWLPFRFDGDLNFADVISFGTIIKWKMIESRESICTHVIINDKKSMYVSLPVHYRVCMGLKRFFMFIEDFGSKFGFLCVDEVEEDEEEDGVAGESILTRFFKQAVDYVSGYLA